MKLETHLLIRLLIRKIDTSNAIVALCLDDHSLPLLI